MMHYIALLTLSLMFLSCATPAAYNIAEFDSAKLREFEVATLAQDYHTYRHNPAYQVSPEAMAQLRQVLLEKGITTDELTAIDQNQVFIGMSQAALFATYGLPYKQNRTVLADSIRIQHIYSWPNRCYVYTINDVVTAIQD